MRTRQLGRAWCLALLVAAGIPAQDAASAVQKAQGLLEQAKAGQRTESSRLVAEALGVLAAAPGAGSDEGVAYCRWMLAQEASQREDWPLAEQAWRAAADYYVRFPGDQERYALAAKSGLAMSLGRQSDATKKQQALELQREVLAGHLRHQGVGSDAVLLARRELAVSLNDQQQWSAALPEWQAIEAEYLRRGMDAELHDARINLCDVFEALGQGAPLQACADTMYERAAQLPVGDARLARQCDAVTSLVDAAATLADTRLRRHAHRLLERAVSERRTASGSQPLSSPSFLNALQQRAKILVAEGDLPGALAALDEYFELWDGTYQPYRNHLVGACLDATSMRNAVGSYEEGRRNGLRVLQVVPQDHLAWANHVRLKIQVANAAYYSGDLDSLRQLNREVVAFFEARWPRPEDRNHRPNYNLARHNLAYGELVAGRFDAARSLFEAVRDAPAPGLHVSAQFHLAWLAHRAAPSPTTLHDLVARYEAEMQESVFGAWRREVRQRLLSALARAGDRSALGRVLLDGLRDALAQIEESLFLSDRERAEALGHLRPDVDWALSYGDRQQPLLQRLVFQVVESRRAAAQAMSGLFVQRQDPELDRLLADYALVREALGETVTLPSGEDGAAADSLRQQGLRRDRLQREIRQRLTRLGSATSKVTVEDLTLRLPSGSAAAGYYRCTHWALPEDDAAPPRTEDRFVAQVVVPGSDAVRLVDLGPAAAIERAIADFRDALGEPVDRGLGRAPAGPSPLLESGRALRRLAVDPVRQAAGQEAKTLYVCLDDALHLVPLDALPTDGDAVLGDEVAVRLLPSFQSLVRPLPTLPAGKPTLLAVGGIDYGKAAAAPSTQRTREDFGFERLPFTADEVVKIGAAFAERFASPATVLRDVAATKAAVAERLPAARFVHLATHGWYAPPGLRSLADPVGDRVATAGHGHSPLSLCGLALALANQGRDRDGRMPGILTAEHLAGLDLRGCELAVLSACRTNVGLRRGGQSIQSLQTALHAAGARHAVTSLWRVPDGLTEELMVRFYGNLWQKGLPPHDALWEAKRWLRKEREARLQHWAAWVLTSQ